MKINKIFRANPIEEVVLEREKKKDKNLIIYEMHEFNLLKKIIIFNVDFSYE